VTSTVQVTTGITWTEHLQFSPPDFQVLRYADRIVVGSATIPIMLQDDEFRRPNVRDDLFGGRLGWIFVTELPGSLGKLVEAGRK
jgi:hypothetical protein